MSLSSASQERQQRSPGTASCRSARDRRVELWQEVTTKLAVMARRGHAGNAWIATNAVRIGAGRSERPSPSEAWRRNLAARRLEEISVLLLEHQGGIALARKPARGRR